MSVNYNQHPAETSIDPAADFVPIWDSSAAGAKKATPNNIVAGATLPGANLANFSVALIKLPTQIAGTLLGRGSAAGVPEVLNLSSDFTTALGVLALTNSYQSLDADLTAIAALVTTAFGRSFLTTANAAALRTLAELLTPTGWGTTDKLVTTHGTDVLMDVGANSVMVIIPVSSATNVDLDLKAKGTGTATLMGSDEVNKFFVSMAECRVEIAGITVADFASSQLIDSLGITVADWQNRSLYNSWVVDALVVGGKLSNTPQSVILAAAAATFAVISSTVILTGDAGANTIATITGGLEGMTLDIFCVDGLVTFTDTAAATANTINLSAAFTGSANDILTLKFINGKWFEKSRSVN